MNKIIYNQCLDILHNNEFALKILIDNKDDYRIKCFKSINKKDFKKLSSGEQVLLKFCCDLWNGSGNVTINELNTLDHYNKTKILNFLNK